MRPDKAEIEKNPFFECKGRHSLASWYFLFQMLAIPNLAKQVKVFLCEETLLLKGKKLKPIGFLMKEK